MVLHSQLASERLEANGLDAFTSGAVAVNGSLFAVGIVEKHVTKKFWGFSAPVTVMNGITPTTPIGAIVLFYQYVRVIGVSRQTGWTALVARLLDGSMCPSARMLIKEKGTFNVG